jgi:sRNA-binding carbon storage regulator CsrA
VAVLATLLKTVKEHQKQDVKVASIAGGILKMTLSAPQRLAKKGVKTVMVYVLLLMLFHGLQQSCQNRHDGLPLLTSIRLDIIDVKVASIAGGILKMTLSAPQRLAKKGVKTVMVVVLATFTSCF